MHVQNSTATPDNPSIIDTRAMLDSGASCCFINPRFVAEHGLHSVLKKRSVRLRTIDNSDVKSGRITHEVHLKIFVGEHSETLVCDITDIGDDNVILGINWLRLHNPDIDWDRSTLKFSSSHCQHSCLPPTQPRSAVNIARSARKRELEKERRDGRKVAKLERMLRTLLDEVEVESEEDLERLKLLGKRGRRGPQAPRSFAKKTNSSSARGRSAPREAFASLKRGRTLRSRLFREQKWAAVKVAKAEIDRALVEALAREEAGSLGAGEDVGLRLGQCWDEVSTRGPRGPELRAAASHTVSQTLAEEAVSDRGDSSKTLEEMVPVQFHEFLDVFDKQRSERLPEHRPHDLAIDLEGEAPPPVGKLYQMSASELRALKEFIDDNLKKGYIRPSKAPCGAPVFFVKKKDGSLRLVVDFRSLNAITRPDSYPIPLTSELLDRLKAAKVFTTLDMRWGYYNVRIREGDEWKTSFRTRYGQFEFLVMQFGLRNAPAAFQRMVNDLFHDLVDVNVVLYLDDIIIFSEDPSQHDAQVKEVLRRLREADLFLKPEKCKFHATEVDYLGVKISPGHVGMDPVKISGVTSWPVPRNVKQVQRFLGFCNFYRRFVEDYAGITRPLERLKGKEVPWRWGVEEQQAFDRLKAAFTSAPVLMMPEMEAAFRVETDASDFALGGILSQEDAEGDWRPVAYFSKALQPAERNYDVHDKELLAVVRALEMWRPYLEGNPHCVDIYSDHRNLEFFMSARDLNRRQARWSIFLNRFVFKIHHRPGRLSAGPDELSRRADHADALAGLGGDNKEQRVLSPERLGVPVPPAKTVKKGVVVGVDRCSMSEVVERVAKATRVIRADDDILARIREVARKDPKLAALWELGNAPGLIQNRLKDFSVEEDLVRFRGLVYVPDDPEVKRWILELYHDSIPAGHPGISNTLEMVARNYYWPRMSDYVRRYVEGCETCQRTKPRRKKPVGKLQPLEIPSGPWQHISTDYVGPLPVSAGFDAIQVVCDKHTKRAHFLPARTTDGAVEMCDSFLKKVWPLHGTPKKIVSDMGPQFIAQFTAQMWRRLGIKRATSTAHHPQTDGQTERVNQELEVYLRAYVDYYQDDWVEWLPFAEFAYNNRFHSSIGMSPFYAEYGYNPTFSIDPVNSQSVPAADERLDRIHQVQESLRAVLVLTAERMKRFHDASVDDTPGFEIGDEVFLERADLRSTRPSAKLDFRRFGPFKVSQKVSDTAYRLDLPDGWTIHNVFHVSCLIPVRQDTIPGRRQDPPPPVMVEGEQQQEIERLLKQRKTAGGVKEFLVKWLGFGESHNEWVPEYDLGNAQEAVAQFLAEEKAKGRVKRKRQPAGEVLANVQVATTASGGEGGRRRKRGRPKKNA